MTSVGYNFNFLCGRPHGALPPSPRPPEPNLPPPCGCHKWMAHNIKFTAELHIGVNPVGLGSRSPHILKWMGRGVSMKSYILLVIAAYKDSVDTTGI